MRPCAPRGFAREVHSVLSRARELSLEPDDLVRIGRAEDRPEWVAAGAFMTEYLEVLDFEGVLDKTRSAAPRAVPSDGT